MLICLKKLGMLIKRSPHQSDFLTVGDTRPPMIFLEGSKEALGFGKADSGSSMKIMLNGPRGAHTGWREIQSCISQFALGVAHA